MMTYSTQHCSSRCDIMDIMLTTDIIDNLKKIKLNSPHLLHLLGYGEATPGLSIKEAFWQLNI